MVMRRAIPAVVLMALAAVSCGGDGREVRTATPTRSATPATQGVALGTCGEPEVRPTFWTPNCGDAGYQLTDLCATAVGTSKPQWRRAPLSSHVER